MPRYDPAEIEQRWQARWEAAQAFRARDDSPRPKRYVLDMFPYPSGAGLHVGHVSNYAISDVLARYARMRGFEVLHPMGWDAFGLPAEQYAIENRVHPRVAVERNVETFRRQLKSLGLSYDWSREISTTDPRYYRWTQWIFLRLLERGLAYEAEVPVNWCEALGTVLANEEVIDGKSERGGHPVVRRPMRQWMLRITAYADRLLEDLDDVDWPERVKRMQREWIGRSEGAEIRFPVAGPDGRAGPDEVLVFTTRPDTLFGATFVVLAPEHPLVARATTPDRRAEVQAYVEATARKSERDRVVEGAAKTGVPTGASVVNPANGERIPAWISDYVLATYGTGAVMAVPAHDARDHAFATRFGLPIVEVIAGGDVSREAHEGEGPMVASGPFTGTPSAEGRAKVTRWLEERGVGRAVVRYRLRDWLFSRQRFWGEPIPVLHRRDGTVVPVPDEALPVRLPDVARYEPTGTGESPLAGVREWVETVDPRDGAPARRETNTMPQWAGSCWYYLRYLDPENDRALVDPERERRWMPVDVYVGGVEHAVLHLLYARFWHKFLHDLGVVSTKEPFRRLFSQGMVTAPSFQEPEGHYLAPSEVETRDGVVVSKASGRPAVVRVERMGKSKKNGVNPDDLVPRYGVDALRVCELFMGPPDADKVWSDAQLEGARRFLQRAWRLLVGDEDSPAAPRTADPATGAFRGTLHRAIDAVGRDMDAISYNTAIARLMELLTEMTRQSPLPEESASAFVRMLAPHAPHVAEELWSRLGHEGFVSHAPWPEVDPKALVEDRVTLPVQVNGKVRGHATVPVGAPDAQVIEAAKALEGVRRHVEGKSVVREIVVPGRMVSLVVR